MRHSKSISHSRLGVILLLFLTSASWSQFVTNNTVINGGTYIGQDGGLFLSGTSFSIDPLIINGLTATGNNIINAGVFEGGDGQNFPLAVTDGGFGVLFGDGTNNVNGGIFSGGSSFSGVTDGSGIGVDVFLTSSLNLQAGTIYDGALLHVRSNGRLDLTVSSNVNFTGNGLVKTGEGSLGFQQLHLGGSGSLSINEGDAIFFNGLSLGSAENITLGDLSSLILSNGIDLAGTISGIEGSSIETYSDMTISGTLSGQNQILLGASTNLINLQSGYSLSSAIFNGSNSYAILSLEDAGIYSSSALGMGASFQDFEEVNLSDSEDTYELSADEFDNGLLGYQLDGGASGGDILAASSDNDFEISKFIALTNNISGFEILGLSSSDDIWMASDNDDAIAGAFIDGRGGDDLIDFLNYRIDSSDIGVLYRNFEGARLESSNASWYVTSDYSSLNYLDGSAGTWTLSYSNQLSAVSEDSSDMGATDYYRNFSGVELTDFDDTWTVGSNDSGMKIDALEGTNTLSGSLSGSSSFGNQYFNFNQVELTAGMDSWTVSGNDTNLFFIDASVGSDTLIYNSATNFADIGNNRLYRNFEQVSQGGDADTWNASTNDLSIGLTSISGGAGGDTLSFAQYEDVTKTTFSYADDLGASSIYAGGFESIKLTSNSDIWNYSSSDAGLVSIDAANDNSTLGDILQISGSTLSWAASLNNRYNGFETLELINTTMDMSTVDPTVFDNVRNQAGSTLSLADNTITINGGYFQTSGAVLELSAQTNLSVDPRIDADDVTFQSGSLISFTGSASDFAINNRYTNFIASATSTLSIEDSGTLFAGSLLDVKDAYELNNSLYAIFDRRSLTNSATGLDVISGSKSANILNEIDTLSTPEAVKMTDAIFSSEFTPTIEDLNKVYDRTVVAPRAMSHQRNNLLRAISERSGERRMMLSNLDSPSGVRGPARNQLGNSLWTKGYSANGSAAADGNLEGYDLSGMGFVGGLDFARGEFVLGVAGGVFNQTIAMDASGDYTGSGTHLSGYLSYGIDGWFFESSASLSSSSLAFESDGSFVLDADYASTDLAFYIGGGYIMRDEDVSWTPEVGLMVNSFSQDAVKDDSIQSVPVELDSLSQATMQLRLGLTGAFRRDFIGRELLTQLKVRWMNSIGILDEEVDFKLTGGANTYQMPLLTTAKSVVDFGIGTQLRMNRSFALLMGFDYEVGGQYTANKLSFGLRYSF
ncbi:MAG: hypothetical protein ACJZ9G_03560 [Rhodospirillales bacterium]